MCEYSLLWFYNITVLVLRARLTIPSRAITTFHSIRYFNQKLNISCYHGSSIELLSSKINKFFFDDFSVGRFQIEYESVRLELTQIYLCLCIIRR